MSWLNVKIPDSAEPERTFQISDRDYAVDGDGYLIAFTMYSPPLNRTVSMVLNKYDVPRENWKQAASHVLNAIKSAATGATLLGTIGLLKRPTIGKVGTVGGAAGGVFLSLDELRAAWGNIEAAATGKNTLKAGYYCKDTGVYITTFPYPIAVNDIAMA